MKNKYQKNNSVESLKKPETDAQAMHESIERIVAQNAWELPNGEHRIHGLDVTKTGKVILVTTRSGNTTHIRAFPKNEHLPEFDEARRDLERDGPSDASPGAAGTIRIRHLVPKEIETPIAPLPTPYSKSQGRLAVIQWVQTHLKTNHPDQVVARRRRTL